MTVIGAVALTAVGAGGSRVFGFASRNGVYLLPRVAPI